MKPDLKRQIGTIMDKHPTFSTALIARRCFASKSDSNEYHFGRPGIPVTLRELEEKMERDVTSLDQFKHIATVMAERMVDSVKGEFTSEAKIIKTEIEKLLKNLGDGSSQTTAVSSAKGKRGNKKANVNATTTEEKAAKVSKIEAKPTRESRRGQKQKLDNAVATPAKSTSEEDEKPAEVTPAKVNEVGKPAAKQPRKKRGAAAKKESKVKKDEEPAASSLPDSVPAVPNKEEAKQQNEGNAKPKRGNNRKSTARGKKQQQNENVPNDEKNDVTPAKKSSEKEEAIKATTVANPNPNPTTTGGGRKRKSGSALAPVNSNRGAKVQKTAGSTTVAAKIITGSPGSPAKIAISGNNLVSLSSLSQPLPPHVVLPTSPIAAPQVQNLKTSVPPPPQVIQLRPAGTVSSTGSSPTTTMQIRPLRAAGTNPLGPRPQFFKIVGGKPVQISGSNVQRLPLGTATSLPGQGGNRLVVMRGPMPSQTVAPGAASAVATAATSTTAGPGNKIILLSNKGQGVNSSGKGPAAGAAPSIVRIVSPNNLTTSGGGKVALNPSSPTKVTTLRQAVGASGPILFRTVAPRSTANTTTSPPIQLPMAPLPKSALTSTPTSNANNKKIVAQVANDSTSVTAKAIQVLLPKSPLPPTTSTTVNSSASSASAAGSGSVSPSKTIGGFTTTTTTTKNGAFVWTNSTRANFKLSSRINFASLDRFKNMVNKDVHFILASIKTEDNSNEFSFRLHLKREPAPSQGEQNKGSKKSQQQIEQSYIEYLELEGKAKVPTAQEWSLKVKTEPPVFLVSKGNFLSDYPGARIPKEIADKPFVDYELHIDKCSPMQVAANAGAAPAPTTATPPPTRKWKENSDYIKSLFQK